MIAFIKGIVYGMTIDSVIIENNGIGYQVFVSNPERIKKQEEIILFTYQHVREDAIILFGFSSNEERDFFLRLISVKGVGPKTALNMLSVCPYKEMIKAIENNDVKLLKRLPGIGPKSAQQIVLDLRGKLVVDMEDILVVPDTNLMDAIEALHALGYKNNELVGIQKELEMAKLNSVDAYIRHALVLLAKRKGV